MNDLSQFAKALGKFLAALQRCDATGGPTAGSHNFYRGGELANYDIETRQAIAMLGDRDNVNTMTDLWSRALASTWHRAPVWVHGDIAIGNLLVHKGKLCAVIDFGQLCIGDPACDLAIAWTLFKGESREAFRNALALDSATWARARGWTLWKALCAPVPGANR
jgi:aminoglycoside phosphotransferase (APT) family kinase protein